MDQSPEPQSRRRRRWRRVLTAALIGPVTFLLLLCLVGFLGLRSSSVRGAILRWAGATLEEATGIHATARDFELLLGAGEIRLEQLELRAGGSGSDPFVKVPTVELVFGWRSLLSDRPQIYSVRMTEPEIDLGAPLPQASDRGEESSEDPFPSVDIHEMRIIGASVISGQVSSELDEWMDQWSASRVSVLGSLVDGAADLEIHETELSIESHRRPTLVADLNAKFSAGEDRDFAIERFELEGHGLELEVSGSGRLESGAPIDLEVELHSNLAKLVPDLTRSGSIDLQGNLEVTPSAGPLLTGSMSAEIVDLPMELFDPLLAEAGWEGVVLEGTQLNLLAQLETRIDFAAIASGPANDFVRGSFDIRWRRGEEGLVLARLETQDSVGTDFGDVVTVDLQARVLPDSEGTRDLDARILVSGWKDLADSRIESFEARDRTERSDKSPRRARPHGRGSGRIPTCGSGLSVRHRTGPGEAPDLDLKGTWRLADELLLTLSARTSAMSNPEDGVLVELGAIVVPGTEGRGSANARIAVTSWGDLPDALIESLELEIEQINLAKLADELGITVEALGGFRPAGTVSLSATAQGPVKAPDLELNGFWQMEEEILMRLSARAASMSNLAFEVELLPESLGARRAEGGWNFTGFERIREGSLEGSSTHLDLPDLEVSLAKLEELLEVLVPDFVHRQEILARLSPEIRDRLQGSLLADLEASGSLDSLALAGTAIWVPSAEESLTVEVSYEEGVLDLKRLAGGLRGILPRDEILQFAAEGRAQVELPIRDATIALQLFSPNEEIQRLDINARLNGGTVALDVSTASVPGSIEASVPLAALMGLFPDSEALTRLPVLFDSGSLDLEIKGLSLGRTSEIGLFLADIDLPDFEIEGVLDALISLEPANPLAAIGTLEVAGLDVRHGDSHIRSDSDLRIDLSEGEVLLKPARLHYVGPGTEAPLDLRLTAEVDPDWTVGGELAALIQDIDLELKGTVDSSALTPFLAGGVATGPLSLAVTAQGSIDDLIAEIHVKGPEASVVLPGKYRTRISEPELEIIYGPSGLEIREIRMRLNRGEVTVAGSQGDDQTLRLTAEFAGVRYRLDHGLTVSADGNLDLTWPQDGRRRLTGNIDVERGSLRRNIQLERELIRMFNATDLSTGGSAFQEDTDLDINLVTREGVRIKNNLADLRADWELIRVRGTLANPTIAGTIDIDPGGLVSAYGQTVRIDSGALVFSGVSGEPPRMDFETTTSSEDPRLRSQWDSVWSTASADKGPGGGFWDRYNPQSGANAFQADEFATGLTSYFQNRFLQSITGGSPTVELSVQPLPLMGETDTTARITMSYHLTPQISYVLSQNPREAEGRTDIVNLQNFAIAPSLRAQIFRNDQANHGVTLQQMLEFGGGRSAEDGLPRLQAIDLEAPKGSVGKRRVRRATGLRKGQPVAESDDFDIEIDMLDAMARKGFPAADVLVEVEPAPRNRVRVGIAVEPGPRVDFEFTGERPQKRARKDIIALYQPTGMEDSPALETIRRDTVRALRARGFLDPQVQVTTELEESGNLTGNRVIRVDSQGGRLVNPQNLAFLGVPGDVAAGLVGLFASRLSRVELAVGEPVADQLFRQSMRSVGYSEAQILSREISEDGLVLEVKVDPGPRRHLAQVRILGVDAELQEALDETRELRAGDPVSVGQIARTSFLMEDYLRELGFASAAVQTRIEEAASGKTGEFDLFYEVEVGREHRIGELQTEGLSASSPAWVKEVSQLEPGELLNPSSITEARRRLARTGIFQRIAIRREETSKQESGSVLTPITIELEEHARYRVTYGVRAESTREAGVVADVSDLNFLGRGQTLGLRLIYATLERNARLYWSIPRVRQTNKNLEFFLETRREEQLPVTSTTEPDEEMDENGADEDSVVADTQEAWAQLTFPWGKRSIHRLYTVYKRSVTETTTDSGVREKTVVSPYSGWQVSFDTGERSFFETSTDRSDGLSGIRSVLCQRESGQ